MTKIKLNLKPIHKLHLSFGADTLTSTNNTEPTQDSFALPVYGSSMYPTLENGDWARVRPIENRESILWGEIYYIEWEDYMMFKRLFLSEDESKVVLWSDNQSEVVFDRPIYSPVTINKDKIRRLCLLTDILKKTNF